MASISFRNTKGKAIIVTDLKETWLTSKKNIFKDEFLLVTGLLVLLLTLAITTYKWAFQDDVDVEKLMSQNIALFASGLTVGMIQQVC